MDDHERKDKGGDSLGGEIDSKTIAGSDATSSDDGKHEGQRKVKEKSGESTEKGVKARAAVAH